MSQQSLFSLPNRGVIALTGPDARGWLDSLVSNDLKAIDHKPVVFTGLLSPQGKVLFEFFVITSCTGLLLDAPRESVDGLMKRLRMYKLRADVALADVSAEWGVVWGARAQLPSLQGAILDADPRAPAHLWRGAAPAEAVAKLPAVGPYVAERVRLGIAEAPDDYALGDIFPHEANYDLADGVSFTKGCFIGQEVVSRMQNKSVVRKRVVRVSADGDLVRGVKITAGAAAIGQVGSVHLAQGLALVRLDRAAEAEDKGEILRAGTARLEIDARAIARYRQSVIERPVHDL